MQSQTWEFRTIVRASIIILGLTVVTCYVLFQARFLLLGPQVTITNTPPMRQNERVVTLTGTTQNISHLYMNGRQIFTDPSGNFSTDVRLENGYTIATLSAADRYGRTTTLTRDFVYVPASFTQ